MPLSAHFLAVTPDGCPEEIEAGPFTEERAKDALFAWEMNHGCPARVVCLVEQLPNFAPNPVASPNRFCIVANGKTAGLELTAESDESGTYVRTRVWVDGSERSFLCTVAASTHTNVTIGLPASFRSGTELAALAAVKE